jgi:flagellar basal-body rod protein FlgG
MAMWQRLVIGCLIVSTLTLGIALGGRIFRPVSARDAVGDNEVVLEIRLRLPSGHELPRRLPRQSAAPRLFEQGALVNTGNRLDLAIEGEGFFQVTLPNGDVAYTRKGNMRLTPNGTFTNADGYVLHPCITVPSEATALMIETDGTVLIDEPVRTEHIQIGQFVLCRFSNPPGLAPFRDGLYLETSDSGSPSTMAPGQHGAGTLHQGFLEQNEHELLRKLLELLTNPANT